MHTWIIKQLSELVGWHHFSAELFYNLTTCLSMSPFITCTDVTTANDINVIHIGVNK